MWPEWHLKICKVVVLESTVGGNMHGPPQLGRGGWTLHGETSLFLLCPFNWIRMIKLYSFGFCTCHYYYLTDIVPSGPGQKPRSARLWGKSPDFYFGSTGLERFIACACNKESAKGSVGRCYATGTTKAPFEKTITGAANWTITSSWWKSCIDYFGF